MFFGQATVVAACLLTNDAKTYATRPFVVSGTCKHKDIESQKKLLHITSSALQESQKGFGPHLCCIASDGDAHCHWAMALLTLTKSVPPSSLIFEILSCLWLFNMLCGDDNLTGNFDWQHILKCFHNTLLHLKGILINGVVITAAVIVVNIPIYSPFAPLFRVSITFLISFQLPLFRLYYLKLQIYFLHFSHQICFLFNKRNIGNMFRCIRKFPP